MPRLSSSHGTPGVEQRWRRQIGPGYTQPVVAGGLAYVGFSNGRTDILAAYRLDDGSEKWRYEIAPTWRGVDGSDDGPMSTPALVGSRVIGLGPRGHLFALDAGTGEERWRVDLAAKHGLKAATYGVATSPLISNGLVIVQVGGGEGRSVVAFDPTNGERRWSTGDDAVEYQSPVMATLGGARQILATTATQVRGIDPATGKVLWQQTYNRKPLDHSCPVVLLGDSRFAIATSVNTVAYEVKSDGEYLSARQIWRTRELKRSYTVPLRRGGFVYGWSGDFLVCVDSATGQRRWKSRQPGLGALLGLADWLVVWTLEGRLVFVRPSPEAYREVATYPVLEVGSLVHPVWAGDGILVRGREELVFLDVRSSAAGADTVADKSAPISKALLTRLADAKQTPLVESDGTVHFVYRGAAEDVGLILGVSPVETPLSMTRVKGSELWYRTEKLNPRGAYVYRFQVDGKQRPVVDPRNDRRASTFIPSSLLEMPSFQPDPAFASKAAPRSRDRGKLETIKFRSKLLDNERSVTIYTPAGFDQDHKYPLVIVTSGMDRIFGRTTSILDRVMGRSVAKAVVVFVDVAPPVDENIFYESLGRRASLYTRMLLEELLPFLEQRLPLVKQREQRMLIGTGLPAARALDAGLRYPQIFGVVAVQSPALNAAAVREFTRVAKAAKQRPRIYLDWCERDSIAVNEGMHTARSCQNLVGILKGSGYEVTTRQLPGGYGWEMWATQTQAILERYLPKR